MAVNNQDKQERTGISRWLLGTNVVVATAMVIAIVVLAQSIAYSSSARYDMTSSGINSLSEGTENLLAGLETNVRLTSLYFETDREEEDQSRYRKAVDDLLGLYAATNRAKISYEWINPLKDHEAYNELVQRVANLDRFKEGLAAYKERVDAYMEDGGLATRIDVFLQNELQQIQALLVSADEATKDALGPVEMLLTRWSDELKATRDAIEREALATPPQFTGSVEALKRLYRQFSKALTDITTHGQRTVATNGDISAAAADLLRTAGERFAPMLDAMAAEQALVDALEPPEADTILQKLGEKISNPIVVETDDDVEVVDFLQCWPPLDPTAGARADFFRRAFKGEEKVTAAILRVTHKEQTAVVFVRYGGQPLLAGGVMPGQPRGPYMVMKEQLADANFVVKEWDLKASDTAPAIDPPPTRTIYIVLKPSPPQRDPMGRPSQDPPFTDKHRDLVLNALGENGRALFIAGWHPGPFGAMPAPYEYGDYLSNEWGITINSDELLFNAISQAPGRFVADARSFFMVMDVIEGDHAIVSGPTQVYAMPWCTPVTLAESPPEGTTVSPLLTTPDVDTLWAAKDITAYEKQLQEKNYMTLAEGDRNEPFTIAVAAEKGDRKLVVVSSRNFAEDQVAFAREMSLGAQGIQIHSRNPGNVALFINALHWLNDNTGFMDVGRPVELDVLSIDSPATMKVVKAVSIVVWPSLALIGGLAAWWIRRR